MHSEIIHYDVDVGAIWNTRIDLLQEIEELPGAVVRVAFTDHKARGDIQSC